MHLIDQWKTQFPRLWSVRLALLAALIPALEAGIYAFLNGQTRWASIATAIVALGAAVARIVYQPTLEQKVEEARHEQQQADQATAATEAVPTGEEVRARSAAAQDSADEQPNVPPYF